MNQTLLGLLTIFVTLKGLGGSFNAFFNSLGISELHGPLVSATIAFLMMVTCTLYAVTPKNTEKKFSETGKDLVAKPFLKWGLVVFILLLVAGTYLRVKKIQAIPIDEGRADMLVTITSQIKDFIEHRDPYQPYTTGQGRTLQRFYLPMLWLSYTPFYLLGVDIRYLNISVQGFILLLLFSCFSQKQSYNGFSKTTSYVLFLVMMALYCFSKQKIADVIDVQTAAFGFFYSLVLWSENLKKIWVANLAIPIVLVCRHPAILLFIPFFFSLFKSDKKRFWIVSLCSLVLCPLLIFPFMKNPYNIIESILFYSGGIKNMPLEITSKFYSVSSLLQRTELTELQKPFQVIGLIFALWLTLTRKLDAMQSLALGGIIYVGFILFVSATPQYVWAEPLILIYFLVNSPFIDKLRNNG